MAEFGERRDDVHIPVWDGSAATFRRHVEDIKWWLASMDLPKTTSFNLAARYVQRQTAPAVVERLRTLDPDALRYTPARYEDEEGLPCDGTAPGATMSAPPNYRAGIDVALRCLEDAIHLNQATEQELRA